FDALGLDEEVAVGWTILQIHLVLQPGAAAAHNRDPEHTVWATLPGQQRADFPGGAGGETNEAFVTHAVVRLRIRSGCARRNHVGEKLSSLSANVNSKGRRLGWQTRAS